MSRQHVFSSVRQVAAIIQTVQNSEGFEHPDVTDAARNAAVEVLEKAGDPAFLRSIEGQAWLSRHFTITDAMPSIPVGSSTIPIIEGPDILDFVGEGARRSLSPMAVSPSPKLPSSPIAQPPPAKRARPEASTSSFAFMLGPLLGGQPEAGPSNVRLDVAPSPAISRSRSRGSLASAFPFAEEDIPDDSSLRKRKRSSTGSK